MQLIRKIISGKIISGKFISKKFISGILSMSLSVTLLTGISFNVTGNGIKAKAETMAKASDMVILETDAGTASEGCTMLGVYGSYYSQSIDALARINEIRKEACDAGNVPDPRDSSRMLSSSDYVPIKWSTDLESIARIRAMEGGLALGFLSSGHSRLNGKDIWSVQYNGVESYAENLAYNWGTNMVSGINQWYGEKEDWVNQTPGKVTGHYTSIINPGYTYIGLGDFYTEEATYPNTLAAAFCPGSKSLGQSMQAAQENIIQKIEVQDSYIKGYTLEGSDTINVGDTTELELRADLANGFNTLKLWVVEPVVYTSSDTSIASVSDTGIVTGINAGTANITVKSGSSELANILVTIKSPATPEPEVTPSPEVTKEPEKTSSPSPKVTKRPILKPTATPAKSSSPSAKPTDAPAKSPSPSTKPTDAPAKSPSPSTEPTDAPAKSPSPSTKPTDVPAKSPSPSTKPVASPATEVTSPDKGYEEPSGINVKYHTQAEIREYAKTSKVSLKDELKFSEEPVTKSPYSLGELSNETLQSALKMLNQVRYIAGISDNVELSDEYNTLCQAAALTNYVNNTLSHSPKKPDGMTDDMYELAKEGAGSSNIAMASWSGCSLNDTIVSSWMEDGDAGNIDRVGHRRWIINPGMGKTGFGAVSGKNGTYSTVYSFDTSNSSAKEYGVAWPAQNMPVEYFGSNFPWSVSMGSRVNKSDVKVTLTRKSDDKTWNFSSSSSDGSFYVNNDGYGQTGCIIFKPKDSIKYKAGDVFKVEVTGLDNPVSYTVNFFELSSSEVTPSASTTPSAKPSKTPVKDDKDTDTSETDESVKPSAKPSKAPAKDDEDTDTSETDEDTDDDEEIEEDEDTDTKPSKTPVDDETDTSSEPGESELPEAGASKKVFVGQKVSMGNINYIVTSVNGTKTVTYTGAKKNLKKIVIPATIKINGTAYKVTAIAKNGFKGNKKLSKVTLGENIKKIGNNAFLNCKNLKNIVIKTKKLKPKTVGKNAFKGINSKAVFKVPGGKTKTYKKIFKSKGASKNIKVKK